LKHVSQQSELKMQIFGDHSAWHTQSYLSITPRNKRLPGPIKAAEFSASFKHGQDATAGTCKQTSSRSLLRKCRALALLSTPDIMAETAAARTVTDLSSPTTTQSSTSVATSPTCVVDDDCVDEASSKIEKCSYVDMTCLM
jgi:hypothetical protein